MNSHIWNARLAAAKRQLNLQHHHHHQHHHSLSNRNISHPIISQFDRLNIDNIDVEEEGHNHFPCPHCYEDVDITSLYSQLEGEHDHDSKITRRHKSRRDAVPRTQALSALRRDLREAHLRVLLGGSGSRSNNASTSNVLAPHPLLSSLAGDFPTSEVEEFSNSLVYTVGDSISSSTDSQHVWKSRLDSSLSHEEREKMIQQAAGRAVFVQDLFLSSLLAE